MAGRSRFLVPALVVDISAPCICICGLFDTGAIHVQTRTESTHVLHDRCVLACHSARLYRPILYDRQIYRPHPLGSD